MDIAILYEDDGIVAVDKPAGLIVHSDGRTKEATLADWVRERYPDTKDVGEPIVRTDGRVIERPGIVHRIDRDTSGVLLVAKTEESFLNLKNQFKSRSIEKRYDAFVWGAFSERRLEGVVALPIGKSRRDFRKYSALKNPRGVVREAETRYRVLCQTAEHAFLDVRPKTGRTHQIRVHLHAIQHPIVCDMLYAKEKGCALGLTRLALHARGIAFDDASGKRVAIESPLPAEFVRALADFPGGPAIASSALAW